MKTSARAHGRRKNTTVPAALYCGSHEGRKLILHLANSLNVSTDATSIAIAKAVKFQDRESRKVSTPDSDSLLATRVHGVESHGIGRGIRDLLESRSHGRAKAVHSFAVSRTDQLSVCAKREMR